MHCSGATAAAANDSTTRNTFLADPNMVCSDSGATVSLYKTDVSDTNWENFRPDVHVKMSGIGPNAIYSDGMGDRILYLKSRGKVIRHVDKNALRCTSIPFNIFRLRT